MSGAPTPTKAPYAIVGTCQQWGSPVGCEDRMVGTLQECFCVGSVPNPVLYGTPTPIVVTSTPTQSSTTQPQVIHFWISQQYNYVTSGGSSDGYSDSYSNNQVYMCGSDQPAAYLVDVAVNYEWSSGREELDPGVNPHLYEDGVNWWSGWLRSRTGPYTEHYCLGPSEDIFQLNGVNYHPCSYVNDGNYPLRVGMIGNYAPNPGRFDGIRGEWYYAIGTLSINIRAVCIGQNEPVPMTPTPIPSSLYCGSVESEGVGGSITDVGELPEILVGPANCSFQFGGISIPMGWANSIAQFAGIDYTFPSKIGLDAFKICAAPLRIGRLEVLGVGIELDQFLLVVSALAAMFMVLRS